jgi:peptidoglycan/LPS O-acetylase OafA/YrhL
LRGLAALGVFLHHMAFFCGDRAADLPMIFAWPASWIMAWGWSLVDLFFVLSGYVFAHVYGAPGQLRRPGAIGDFWVSRFARLWPLHLVTLAVFALVGWGRGNNDLGHFIQNLLMLQGFDLDMVFSFNIPSWSLSIEMLAYALFALGARAGSRSLFCITVLAVAGGVAWLALLGYPRNMWHGEMIVRGLTGFFMGQLLWRGRKVVVRVPSLLLAVILATGLWLEKGGYNPLLPLSLLSWPAAVLLALRMPWLERGLFAWLGERSFGIYMVHLMVIDGVNALWPPHWLGGLGTVLSHVAIMLLTLACAECAYRRIEIPGRAAIRAFWVAHRPAKVGNDKAISAQPA